MPDNFQNDVDAVGRIDAVPIILEVVCRTTGMGFAAVARVTEDRWIACRMLDTIDFGLKPGGELKVETTICHEIRESRVPVVINHVAEDSTFCHHPTPAMYGFQSYISMPIIRRDGQFFGTLCAIDPRPARLQNPETIGMFKLFAELIAFHLDDGDELSKARSELINERGLSELREQFIAVLGHDLRNPLGSISSGARMLLRNSRDEEQSKILQLMQGSVARMRGLIDNVMDLARARLGGGIGVTTDDTRPLQPTLDQVVAELHSVAADRVIETTFDIDGIVPVDHARVAQLLSNLLGNAHAYGAVGSPILVVARTTGGVFELSVTNTGPPIPRQTLDNLFQPFFRGKVEANQKGLGLGLYIASEIARAHGGTLEVTSEARETRFTCRLPLERRDTGPAGAPRSVTGASV